MKIPTLVSALALSTIALHAAAEQPQAYINENLGFNVKGYKYSQSEFPCDIDKKLVALLLDDGKKAGIQMEAVSTADKIRNGVIPVVAIDIEQLVLGSKEHTYGAETHSTLPKVQVTAAVIKGDGLVTAKHTCAIATLNELTPSSSVLDLGTNTSICSVTRRCLRDLSKDIIEWVAPQLD
jgi:hypothetical protein